MKKMLPYLLVLLFVATGNAQELKKDIAEVQSFKAGGIPIVIPAPTKEMVEVGYDNREFMEFFVVAPENRLLASFVLADDLPGLTQGEEDLVLSKFAAVQVPRRGEYRDVTESMFKEVTDIMESQFGSIIGSSIQEAEDELNRRMKSIDLDDVSVSFGRPIQLGCLFSKKHAYSFGMIIPLSMGGVEFRMCVGATLALMKNRMLFIYLYAEYQDEKTVIWLRNSTEEWVDAILEANR